jgi:hypothetical protein
MVSLLNGLNLSNPDENTEKNIKDIVKTAILEKQEALKRSNVELDNLNQQEQSGVYDMPIDTNTGSNVHIIAVAILTILSDMLHGFQEATKYMKDDAVAIETDNGRIDGLNSNVIVKMGGSIKAQADVLTRLISGANKQINKLIGGVGPSTGSGQGTVGANAGAGANAVAESDDTSLGEEGKQLAMKTLHVMKDIGEFGLKMGIKWYGDVMVKLVDTVMELTGEEDILNTPIDKLSPELNKKILVLAGVLKGVSTNPVTKQAVKEIAQSVAITMIEVLKEIRPEVNKVADQGTEMLEEVSEKFVAGATGTGISVIQAFLAEIPFVGGMIDLFIAIGKGFNTLARTYKVFVDKSGKMVVTSAQTIKNTEDTAMKGKDRIMSAVENVTNTINAEKQDSVVPTGSGNASGSGNMAGGAAIAKSVLIARINSKIKRSDKRLRKTLKFFNETLPKLKFMPNEELIHRNRTKKSRKSRQ